LAPEWNAITTAIDYAKFHTRSHQAVIRVYDETGTEQGHTTGTSSHELCEAITDAVPGTGWYEDTNGEIGDICAWNFKTVDRLHGAARVVKPAR
jgi:hypothetical protein